MRVTLSQSGKDTSTIHRFAKILKPNGKLYGPYNGRGNRSGFTTWYAHGSQALEVITWLWPYLGEPKRNQAREAFSSWWSSSALKVRTPKAKIQRVYKSPTDKQAQRRLYYQTHQEQIKKQAHEWYLANKNTLEYKQKRRDYMREFRRKKKLGI